MATNPHRSPETQGMVQRLFVEHPRSLGMTWAGHGVAMQNGGETTPHAEHQNALERDQQHRDQQRIITPGNEQRGAEGERARAKRT